ncbi:kinase-like domain-containing protein [Pelagophyceae sp. CCMP2097]|nr:kinase-like domain-containing protein [Pelagophyceae sp. CCMP2097]
MAMAGDPADEDSAGVDVAAEAPDLGVDSVGLAVCGASGMPPLDSIDEMPPRDRWRLVRKIGEGAFGEVHVADDALSGERVAVKLARLVGVPGCERDDGNSLPKGVLRELWSLQRLVGAAHVSQYIFHFPRGSSLALVLAFCDSDLRAVLDALEGAPLTEGAASAWLGELLCGLKRIHAEGLMHRDLKPGNLLIEAHGALQICDFGQARPLDLDAEKAEYTHQVSTRAYRAPEILFGARKYTERVDAWAAGCVFCEMLENTQTFPANSDIEQLISIFKKMGAPSQERWPSAHELPDFCKIQFPDMPPVPLGTVSPHASPLALGLLGRLLVLEPARRCSASDALADAFFVTGPARAPASELAALVRRAVEHAAKTPQAWQRCQDSDSW